MEYTALRSVLAMRSKDTPLVEHEVLCALIAKYWWDNDFRRFLQCNAEAFPQMPIREWLNKVEVVNRNYLSKGSTQMERRDIFDEKARSYIMSRLVCECRCITPRHIYEWKMLCALVVTYAADNRYDNFVMESKLAFPEMNLYEWVTKVAWVQKRTIDEFVQYRDIFFKWRDHPSMGHTCC